MIEWIEIYGPIVALIVISAAFILFLPASVMGAVSGARLK